jgi:oligoendopeptidase F
MENASKALIMAGGILIAILILAILTYVWNSVGFFSTTVEEQKKLEQIAEFNKEYESYQRKILRGTDIATIINKIEDNNKRYPEAQIIWQFELVQDLTNNSNVLVLSKGKYVSTNSANKTAYFNVYYNQESFKKLKELYFMCTKVEYSNQTGKVNKMIFKEQLSTDIFR